MALAADLGTHIDAGALVSTLVSALQGHGVNLRAVSVPDDGGRLGQINQLSSIDLSSVGSAVQTLAHQLAPQLAALLPQVPALDALVAAIALVEQASSGDLLAELEQLATTLGNELEGSSRSDAGGLIGVLMRVVGLLGSAPAAGRVSTLLQAVLGLAGVQTPNGVKRLADLLPAADAGLRAVGGLMALESLLAESQRLTGLMAAQIDAPGVVRELQGLAGAMDATLLARINTVDIADAAALRALADLLAAGAQRFETVREQVAAGIGLGEATLTYLDVGRVQQELDTTATLLRGIDLGPLGRLLADALAGLAPITQIDIEHAPAQSLDALLSAAEAGIGVQAARITAWDTAALVAPVTQGLNDLTAPLATLTDTIASLTVALRSAMESVRQVVSATPVRSIADAVQTVLAPVNQALALVTALVGDISAALRLAAQTALAAVEAVEGTVDDFKAQVEALFAQAEAFINGLHLEQIAGDIGQRVAEFSAALERAQMKPYFDTAVSAIGTARDVVAAVPFNLLPSSMKADVDAAIKPIKDTNLPAVEAEIEAALGIGADGRFLLRADLQAALADVQRKYDALLAVVRSHNPQTYLAQIDAELQTLAGRIRDISPQLTLQPVQDAIKQVRSAITGVDLAATLAPLQQVFDQALATLGQYAPAVLIAPLSTRVDAARNSVKAAIRLERWAPVLDDLSGRATGLLNQLDPAQLQPQIEQLLAEAKALVDGLPASRSTWPGAIIARLLQGLPLRIDPTSFATVAGWINGTGPAAPTALQALAARSDAIASAVARTLDAVQALDFANLAAPAINAAAPLRSALLALVGRLGGQASEQARFSALADRFNLAPVLAQLASNRDRFLARLQQAAALAETLRRTGLSEVTQVVAQLNSALAPVLQLLGQVRTLVRKLGVGDVDHGLVAMVRSVFQVLPPARLAGLVAPLFVALRGRVLVLIDAVLAPVKAAITRLAGLIDAISLAPLVSALQAVYDEVRADLQALSPATLLAQPLAAFSALQAELAGFDPLAPLLTLLDGLRDTAVRVLAKLSAQQLLQSPLAIYNTLLAALATLDIQSLLAPVFDTVDAIALQVDSGLDDTVSAFQGLQAALPGGAAGAASLQRLAVGAPA